MFHYRTVAVLNVPKAHLPRFSKGRMEQDYLWFALGLTRNQAPPDGIVTQGRLPFSLKLEPLVWQNSPPLV